jgi:LysR family glycine cleavage system transcriptional activator
MDHQSLRCFVAAAETETFRVAAARVALSPAALSDRIASLEDQLGVALFTRTTRRVTITEAGTRLLPHARKLLDDAARCRSVALGDQSPLPFALTLGTRAELGLSWLCPALAPLEAERPERVLHLYMADSGALLDRLERGALDAVVLSARLTRPHLETALLHEEAYAFVTATDGPRAAHEAQGFTLIDATPDLPLFSYLLDALPEGPPWRFRDHRYVGGISTIRHQVLAGRGVAVLPRYFIHDDLLAGHLVELLPKRPPRSDWFRLIWRADHPRADELVRLAASLRAWPLR